MNFKQRWSKETYSYFLEYLKTLKDENYRKFHLRIVNDKTLQYIGIRAPILRKIAKNISNFDYEGFLKFNTHRFYEERAIHGFIISYVKSDYNTLIKMLRDFIPYISNWALTDLTATKFKQVFNNKSIFLKEVLSFAESSNPWEVRLSLVLLLNIYIENNYIDEVLKVCKLMNKTHSCKERSGEIPYYVRMGSAWLLSECYVKFSNKVENMLKENSLEKWIHNKAIQKITESQRVSKKLKERVLKLKI